MIVLALLFLIPFVNGANKALIGFTIAPGNYIDCAKWLDNAAKRPGEFPSYSVNVDDINPLANLLTIGMLDAKVWPTKFEPNYIAPLKEHAVFKASENGLFVTKPAHTLFVCFLASVQLYKLVNRLQLETAYRISCNNHADEVFSRIKTDDFARAINTQTSKKVAKDSEQFFGLRLSQKLLDVIKEYDSCLINTPYSGEYEAVLLLAFRSCLLGMNEVILEYSNSAKSKL